MAFPSLKSRDAMLHSALMFAALMIGNHGSGPNGNLAEASGAGGTSPAESA
jgi:hypothetical protein